MHDAEGYEREHMIDHDDHHEAENYMFFGNLETIHRVVGELLEMDPKRVDEVLKNGHSWAVDHIATSKDDIEEVANFLINEMEEESAYESEYEDDDDKMLEEYDENEDEMHDMYDEDEDSYHEDEVRESYICEGCGSAYESAELNEDMTCNECGGKVAMLEGEW